MEDIIIISEETIKPSSPTPPEKAFHRLSRLDQLAPNTHISLLFFYTHGFSPEETLPRLRTSLSETLSIYYPLAGRVKDKPILSCNDEGVLFLEARVRVPLSTILNCRDAGAVDKLLPCLRLCAGKHDDGSVATFQVNFFSCGGVAVGARVSHRVLDGLSLAVFMKTWAYISRFGSSAAISHPTFEAAEIFPPQADLAFSTAGSGIDESSTVTKVFPLDGAKLAALRASEKLTRVEAASALIWRCLVRSRSTETLTRAYVASQVVNLRRRMQPPLEDSAVGNLWVITLTEGFVPSKEIDLHSLTDKQMINAMKNITSYLKEGKNIREEGELARVLKLSEDILARYSDCGVELCCFSSFCGFPVYEVDFGWGEPNWVARGSLYFNNSVTLMPVRERKGEKDLGMEAWVSLEREEMSRFERDPELLSLLSSSVPFFETLIPSLQSTEESSDFLSPTQETTHLVPSDHSKDHQSIKVDTGEDSPSKSPHGFSDSHSPESPLSIFSPSIISSPQESCVPSNPLLLLSASIV